MEGELRVEELVSGAGCRDKRDNRVMRMTSDVIVW